MRLDKPAVPGAFDTQARAYDRLVGANPGYHKHLRLSAARLGLPGSGEGLRLLDLGCGTGASTAALLRVLPRAEIVAVDASAEMLAVARSKKWPATVTFVHSRAEDLELEGGFDGILAAYLIRNVDEPDPVLATIRSLLAPGAPVAFHEYSVADSRAARWIWTAVAWAIIIPLGKIVTRDAALYRYLWRSVLDFDGVRAFCARLERAGFTSVREQHMTGWQRSIVHTFLAHP